MRDPRTIGRPIVALGGGGSSGRPDPRRDRRALDPLIHGVVTEAAVPPRRLP